MILLYLPKYLYMNEEMSKYLYFERFQFFPQILFKGNQSILAAFEDEIGPTTINASSFSGSLEWLHNTRTWNITVIGTNFLN